MDIIRETTPARGRRDGGFALPAAIFALVLLGVMATSGFFVTQQESRITVASEHSGTALYLAEQGMHQVRLDWYPPVYNDMPVGWDTTHTGTGDGGTWSVVVSKTDTTNYFLDATGQVTDGGAVLSGATRRVGMLARVVYPSLYPQAALTTQGSLFVRGQAEISGYDETLAGRACPALDDVAGIRTADTTLVKSAGKGTVDGTPVMLEDTTIGQVGDSTFTKFGEISWDQLVAMADLTFPGQTMNPGPTLDAFGECDYSDKFNWGDPLDPTGPCADYYPVIHFTGDASLQGGGSGQGILLVDGNLQMQGTFTFQGVVVVKGTLDTRGSGSTGPRILGGVYAGNADIESQGGAGRSKIQMSSCAIHEAISNSLKASRPLPLTERSWIDLSNVSY